MPNDQDQRVVKALGPVMLRAAVVNVTVGGGIFRLPAQLSYNLSLASPRIFVGCAADAVGYAVFCRRGLARAPELPQR